MTGYLDENVECFFIIHQGSASLKLCDEISVYCYALQQHPLNLAYVRGTRQTTTLTTNYLLAIS